MLRLSAPSLTCSLVALALALTAGVSTATAAQRTIIVGDDYFVQEGGTPAVTVRRNTRIRWEWVGRSPHDVRVESGPEQFASHVQVQGHYTRRMTRRGRYSLFCSVHGAGMGMVVRVR